jgi:signal transduction histidine kinase
MIVDQVVFLLVDDSEDNLVALEALLRREGLEILKARSGSEALELLLVHEVALAFIDVQMPNIDGFDLAAMMRGAKRTKHVPIIFVTVGSPDRERAFKGYETGAVDFIFKPIDPRILKWKADVFFELSRQRKELANALRLNEMFVGILGHDLRNPLGTMLMGAQLLERQLSDEAQLKTIRRVNSAGRRMMAMIEQILDLTRARLAGGLGLVRRRKRLDVGNLVERTVDEFTGAHPERELSVEILGDSTTSGDADRLLQVFSNLISNALQHGESGSGVLVAVDGTDREIVIQVRNRGAIPAGLLSTIFDPFRGRQNLSSTSRLGLGLFIAQQIVLAHGGTLGVESSESTGTIFTVRLPRRSVYHEHTNANVGGIQRTVAIVDEDESIRASLREAFEEEGYKVATAANGRLALELLAQSASRPDVVIMGLGVPVVDGDMVYQAMRANAAPETIPFIVSTSPPAEARCGVIVVPKPINIDELLETVAELWRKEAVEV